MLEVLVRLLERRLSREGRFVLRAVLFFIVIGLLIYFLNFLRLSYLGALSNAVNAVD